MVDINGYVYIFPSIKVKWNIGETELDKIIFNNIPNLCIKQEYVQGSDFETNAFKKAVNMVEYMDISETIYEGVVETSYQNKTTITYSNCAGFNRKIRVGSAPSKRYSKMYGRSVKGKKRYVDHPRDRSKLTCIIHVNGGHY